MTNGITLTNEQMEANKLIAEAAYGLCFGGDLYVPDEFIPEEHLDEDRYQIYLKSGLTPHEYCLQESKLLEKYGYWDNH